MALFFMFKEIANLLRIITAPQGSQILQCLALGCLEVGHVLSHLGTGDPQPFCGDRMMSSVYLNILRRFQTLAVALSAV